MTKGVSEHVWVHPPEPHPGVLGEMLQPTGGGVPVHPRPTTVHQDRTGAALGDGPIDGSGHRRGSGTRTTRVPLPTTRRTRWA